MAESLPQEMLTYILSFLPLSDQKEASLVSRAWYCAAQNALREVKFSGKQTLRQGLPTRSLLRIHTHKGVRQTELDREGIKCSSSSRACHGLNNQERNAACTSSWPEMMGSLELGPEADVSQLEPLLTLENIEQLEATFVSKVRANVVQWLQKALDGEVAEWGREQEPDTDPSGFYHSPMPAIVLQILEENIRVTSLVSESLQRRVHGMALSELGAFLRSFSDALIRFSRDHLRGEAMAPHYVSYLLAALNHQSALSSSVSVLQPDGVASGALAPVEAALEELQRRICRLVLEALLVELQPLFMALPSRQWLSSPELLDDVCERTARFCREFWRVRNPAVQLLLAEAERTVVLQYLCALMQGRLVCRGADERNQAAERLQHDAAKLQDLFLNLGLEESFQCASVLLTLRKLLNLRDPTMLGLEVAGLRQQFPDVSEDHVSALLDLRGDVSREQRLAALSSLQAGPQPSPPAGRRALFSLVPAPTPAPSSCLPSGPCA
ncbi:exocyst complex component 3-like protein isoform 5-T6 [Hipposideros larvatus]